MANQDLSQGAATGGTSYIYRQGSSPETRTVVSQKIKIRTPHYGTGPDMKQMGLISSMSPSESRSADPVSGIGFGDTIAERVPGPTQPMDISVERTMLYLCNLWQATGYAAGISGPVRSLKHHRWPFDTEMSIVFSTLADQDLGVAGTGFNGKGTFQGGANSLEFPAVTDDLSGKPGNQRGHTVLVTYYEGCWWTSWSVSISKDQGMVGESGTMSVTDIHDFSTKYGEFLATGNDPTIGQKGSIRFK